MYSFYSSRQSVGDPAAGSAISTQDPVITTVVPATEPPVLLQDWLECFKLNVVDVPATGHCMYGAFFAATAGTCDKGKITYEGETLEQVQACRERILYAARDQIAVEAELGH